MSTDDELIAAYEAGDEAAFSVLVDRHLPSVYALLSRLIGNSEEKEDIAQETFLKTWKNLKRFKKGANFKTWILAIARNSAIDYLRKRKPVLFGELTKKEDEGEFEHRLLDTTPSAEAILDASFAKEKLEKALETLPHYYREILILHYREELTLEEAADVLAIPLNTAKSRDRRALQSLKKILEPEKD